MRDAAIFPQIDDVGTKHYYTMFRHGWAGSSMRADQQGIREGEQLHPSMATGPSVP